MAVVLVSPSFEGVCFSCLSQSRTSSVMNHHQPIPTIVELGTVKKSWLQFGHLGEELVIMMKKLENMENSHLGGFFL